MNQTSTIKMDQNNIYKIKVRIAKVLIVPEFVSMTFQFIHTEPN